MGGVYRAAVHRGYGHTRTKSSIPWLIAFGYTGRIDYKESDWPPATFDMDSLALQVVPNPGGAFPLTRYASLLGTPGLSAYVGFEGLAEAAPVSSYLEGKALDRAHILEG